MMALGGTTKTTSSHDKDTTTTTPSLLSTATQNIFSPSQNIVTTPIKTSDNLAREKPPSPTFMENAPDNRAPLYYKRQFYYYSNPFSKYFYYPYKSIREFTNTKITYYPFLKKTISPLMHPLLKIFLLPL